MEQKTERENFYTKIAPNHLTPLWEVLNNLVPKQPVTACVAVHWDYEAIRPFILEAGELISAEEAVRRVLILENPGLPGESRITNTLYAGLQFIKPGEVAPCHRHVQSAFRFIVEGKGAYTAVDGEKTTMAPGDFVLTPSWTWHDHGNESDEPMVWLDGLDVPLVQFFEAQFVEDYPDSMHPMTHSEGDALARYGSGLLPTGYEKKSLNSPVFNYPYERTREALEVMKKAKDWDPHHGLKMTYVNPTTGGYALPTMAAFIQLLPKSFKTELYQSTGGTVFSVVEGHGRTRIGDQVYGWKPKDIFVVPSWVPYTHEADDEAVLFSFSDQVVQENLGIWREKKG